MRILIVITKGELGGAQTHVLELCRALKHQFKFLVLIGGSEKSALGSELHAIGVQAEQVKELSNSLSPIQLLQSVRHVSAKIRAWGPDAIHAHSAVAGVVGRLAGWVTNVPAVYTVHGFGFKPQVPLLRRSVVFLAEQVLAPLTARLICVSEFELELAQRLYIAKRRVRVISNGIADIPLRASPGAEPATFIMVARMAAPKRHDLLIQALALLRKRGITLPRVVFAGGGPCLPHAQSACYNNDLDSVEMPGDLTDIPSRLARCQVFILLSDHEGQPISIIEAMRAGMPIIASDLPGIRSQVLHGSEGLLTNNSPDEVADAVEMLLNNPAKRIEMGQAARQRYEREFSAENMAKHVADVYVTLTK